MMRQELTVMNARNRVSAQRRTGGAPLTLLLLVACVATARADGVDTIRTDTTRMQQAAFKRHSVVPLPVLFYSPETRLGGGVALLHAYRSSADGRPIASAASLMYTQNRQIAAGISTDAYLTGGRNHVTAGVGYSKFPTVFYGIGNATARSDSESYTPRTFTLELAVDRRLAPGVYVGIGGDFATGSMVEVEPGRALASGLVPGSDIGNVAGLGAAVTYDTRDNILAAESGAYAKLSARRYAAVLGSDFDFSAVQLDLRRFTTFAAGHVVAVQASWAGTSGDVPFTRLPQLGGQNLLRGYYQGRYRDRQYVAAQAEYRTPMWRRTGLAAFGGAGEVAPSLGDLSLRGIHAAGGAGLRVLLNRQERLALRLDYGAGGGSSGFYITVGEAF
jgi:outer membrane protein assembly factor BamA